MVVLIFKCRTRRGVKAKLALVAGFQPPLLIIIVQSLIGSVFLICHRSELTEKAWKNTMQGLDKLLGKPFFTVGCPY